MYKHNELIQTVSSITSGNVSIINIQETKLKHDTSSGIIEIDGFHLLRLDRNLANFDDMGGGGLLTYVSKKWCPQRPKIIEAISCPDVELLSVVCRPMYLPSRYRCIISINLYMRPQRNKTKTENIIRKCLLRIESHYPRSFITACGDANSSCIKACEAINLVNIIRSPTYFPSESQLDVAYVSEEKFYLLKLHPPIGSANVNFHLSYLLQPTVSCDYKEKVKTTIMKKQEEDVIKRTLNDTDWRIFESDDIDEMVESVDSYVGFIIENYTTRTTINYDIFSRFRNKNLKELCKHKHIAINDKDKVKRNEIQRQINKLVKHMRASLITNMTQKQFYSYLNRCVKGSNKLSLPDIDDADKINKFFCRHNSDYVKDINIEPSIHLANSDQIHLAQVEEVRQLFRSVKGSSSSGRSNIPANIFKTCADELAKIYTKIYNKSLTEMTYPGSWKHALITPVPKTKTAIFTNMKDYRPIAVTPIQARILDKIALKRLEKPMENSEDRFQFAYKQGRDTTDALICTLDFIMSKLDENPGCIIKTLYLDYSSAFNTVLQNRLLNYVNTLCPYMAKWLLSYMSGWSQSVKAVGGKASEPITVLVGIPQGGPLSAKLFTYCTDKINNTSLKINPNKSNICKYSDDTRLIQVLTKDNAESDQQHYKEATKWIIELSSAMNLKLNPSKCIELLSPYKGCITESLKSAAEEDLVINEVEVQRASHVKYLGVHISNDLKWYFHIKKLTQKLNFMIKSISPILPFLPKHSKMQIFHSFICSNLLYAAEAWGCGINKNEQSQLRKVIKFYAITSKLDKKSLLEIINQQYCKKVRNRFTIIENDEEHPLHLKIKSSFQMNYNTRNRRIISTTRTKRYQSTFIPATLLSLTGQAELVFL